MNYEPATSKLRSSRQLNICSTTATVCRRLAVEMKIKFLTTVCVLALSLGSVTPALASSDDGPLTVAADFIVVRPACLVATVIGSALFVAALPIAATSRSVKKTAHTLVISPAKATFTRPLGDMEALTD